MEGINSTVSQTEETGISLQRSGSNFDGGDGGELNSSTLNNPLLLIISLLDQISAIGETVNQLKTVLENPTKTNLVPKQTIHRL